MDQLKELHKLKFFPAIVFLFCKVSCEDYAKEASKMFEGENLVQESQRDDLEEAILRYEAAEDPYYLSGHQEYLSWIRF